MYLIPVPVPIIVRGSDRCVASEWKRALLLLRDSLGGRYGDLLVAAPWVTEDDPLVRGQAMDGFSKDDGVVLEPLFPAHSRTRNFWTRDISGVTKRLTALVSEANVVHASLDELFRPMTELAFLFAVRAQKPTVFVQDTDIAVQIVELEHGRRAATYAWAFEKICRASVRRADLTLLKGKALMDRYAPHAKNARKFQNTSYQLSEVVDAERVEARLATIHGERPLRFVYCGRLVARKGLADSLSILERVRGRGGNVTLDVIGSGEEESALRSQVERARLADAVHFHGALPYGAELLRRLAEFDAILFTPTAEDTPRMIFDGYAAGLPLVASGIPYVKERADEERATVLLPRGDLDAAAERVLRLCRNRSELVELTRAAVAVARHNAADAWYARRAEWTHEAVSNARQTRRSQPPTIR